MSLQRKTPLLNGITNIQFETDNVFDRLKLYDTQKRKFDTIILDPPAFAKSRAHIRAAVRGYKEINLQSNAAAQSGRFADNVAAVPSI